jgi:O-antigen/teichoic acid export membrane protein
LTQDDPTGRSAAFEDIGAPAGATVASGPAGGRGLIGQSALTGVGSLLAARIIVGGSTLLLFALLAQGLPSTQFGLFGVAWSVSYLFAAVVEGGYGLLVVREIARSPAASGYYLGAFLSVRVAVALLALAAAAGLSMSSGWDSLPAVLAMAATAANLQVVSGVPRDFLIGSDRSELAAAHSIAETVLRTVVILITAANTTSITTIFAAAALFHLAWTAIGLPLVWFLLRPRGVSTGVRSWRAVLRDSLPFGALVVLGAAYAQIDVVIVSTLLPLETVAVFLVASRILAAMDYLPEAAWRWAYPRLSRSGIALPRRTSRLAVALLVLGVVVAAGVAIAAPVGIPLLFGEAYRPAIIITEVMAAAIPLRYLAHVYGTALSAGGRQVWRTLVFLTVITIAMVVEIALISVAGLNGAALAVVFSSALLAGSCLAAGRIAWGRALDRWPLVAAALVAVITLALSIFWPR